MTNQEIAQKLKDLMQRQHTGLKSLQVDVSEYGIITFKVKSRNALKTVVKDCQLCGAFRSILPQYWEHKKLFVAQCTPK